VNGPSARAVSEPQSAKDLGSPWILAFEPEQRAALAAPRRATRWAAIPTESPWPCGPGHPLWAGWPWPCATTISWVPWAAQSRVGRLSCTHTWTSVRFVPPGGPQIFMRRQGAAFSQRCACHQRRTCIQP